MKTLNAWTAIRAALIAAVVAVASPAFAGDLPLKDARLKIEYNATDRDVGVQLLVPAVTAESTYDAAVAPRVATSVVVALVPARR